jgi:RNA polymerase sigma-70 factor (ECF subfamily)
LGDKDMSNPSEGLTEEWVRTHGPRAVAYAMTLIRDRDASEDVVQEALCGLLRNRERYDLARDGEKLLFTAVTNQCRNWLARRRRSAGHWSMSKEDGAMDVPDRRSANPIDSASAQELGEVIERSLATLPERQRAVLHLSALGWPLGEVAAVVGVTPNNAGVLLHRARRTLAESLGPYLDEVRR